MACYPTKLDHIQYFFVSFTLQLPAQSQIKVTFNHHIYPITFWIMAKQPPYKSNVELPHHECSWWQPWFLIVVRCLLDLIHGCFNGFPFNFRKLPLNLFSLSIVNFQIWVMTFFRYFYSFLSYNRWHLNFIIIIFTNLNLFLNIIKRIYCRK